MKKSRSAAVVICLFSISVAAIAQAPPPVGALARMPVKEVTIFKDGHVFVLHEGNLATDASGNVLMDYMPTPVLGTFWPYSSDKNSKLVSVVASQRKVVVERTALSLREMLEANAGAEVIISEPNGVKYAAVIEAIPARSSSELEATGPPNSGEKLPVKGEVIMLKTADGLKVLPLSKIEDVTFRGRHTGLLPSEEFRNLLTLKLDWGGRKPEKTAAVGLLYLQRGVRWIPGYKVTLDGQGNAIVKLQATLLNEMVDLANVTANLVIGVPTFAFKDTIDPISLQQVVAQLSPYFQQGSLLSNAISTQVLRPGAGGVEAVDSAADNLGPEVAGAGRNEDLFVFTVNHVSLKKGERMVLPVTEYPLKYKDVYALDLSFAPPPEIRANLSGEQQAEMARLLASPKVMHKVRLRNQGSYPLTTAPALIVRDDRVLGQGTMTYAASGASTDLDITSVVDVQVSRTENETSRTPDAVKWQGYQYARVDLAGKATLTNYRTRPIEVEVTRHVPGNVASADHGGVITRVNVFDGGRLVAPSYPHWWSWYNWPAWWHHLNGISRVTWSVRLEPGASVDLGYSWHYFWR